MANITQIFSCFSRGILSHVTSLDQSCMIENIWCIAMVQYFGDITWWVFRVHCNTYSKFHSTNNAREHLNTVFPGAYNIICTFQTCLNATVLFCLWNEDLEINTIPKCPNRTGPELSQNGKTANSFKISINLAIFFIINFQISKTVFS